MKWTQRQKKNIFIHFVNKIKDKKVCMYQAKKLNNRIKYNLCLRFFLALFNVLINGLNHYKLVKKSWYKTIKMKFIKFT